MATFHVPDKLDIHLSDDKKTATREGPSSFHGIVFSADPVNPGEMIKLKVEDWGVPDGYMGIGLTAEDPILYKGERILDIPRTYFFHGNGSMYDYDGVTWWFFNPVWRVSIGDTVTLQWSPPTATLYQNKARVHSWKVPYTEEVWMVAQLVKGMRLRISGQGIELLKELCYEEILKHVRLEDIHRLPLPKRLKQETLDMYISYIGPGPAIKNNTRL